MDVDDRPSVETILDLVRDGRRDAVLDLVGTFAGSEGLDAVVDLLADVQREVGRRWHHAQWTVADEHAATAVIDLALAVVTAADDCEGGNTGSLVVACAEEEWHVLPPRMLAEQLRSRGWNVRFLGGSLPADHLRDYVDIHRPGVVVVSCSTPMFLPGVRRSVAGAHAARVPVLVGGAALGDDPIRAVALGADGWAPSVHAADRIARDWIAHPPPLANPADDRDQLALAADRPVIVSSALVGLSSEVPSALASWTSGGLGLRDDLDLLVRILEAAMVTRDDRVVGEHVQWLVPYLELHGVTRAATTAAFRALGRELTAHPRARSLLDLAAATLDRVPR